MLALAATGVTAQTNGFRFPVLVTTAGIFSNAQLGTIKSDYVTVLHEQGGTRVAMSNLPPSLQEQLGLFLEATKPKPATNSVKPRFGLSSTNGVVDTNNPVIIAKQLAATSKAMMGYFEYKKDSITYFATIDQLDYDQVSPGLQVELVCLLHPGEQIPKTVGFLIHSESETWRFAENHPLSIEAGTLKRDYGTPMDHASVVPGGVTEGFLLDWSWEDLHNFAWADDFWFRLGMVECQVTAAQRLKWKLLWKYFDLLKQQQMASFDKRIQGNWSIGLGSTNAILIPTESIITPTNLPVPTPLPVPHAP
jgi:hypothetical protein